MDIKNIKEYLDWQKAKKTATKVAATVLATVTIATGAMGLTSCSKKDVENPEKTTINPEQTTVDTITSGTNSDVEIPDFNENQEGWVDNVKVIDDFASNVNENFNLFQITITSNDLENSQSQLECYGINPVKKNGRVILKEVMLTYDITKEEFDKFYKICVEVNDEQKGCFFSEQMSHITDNKWMLGYFRGDIFKDQKYAEAFAEMSEIIKNRNYELQESEFDYTKTQEESQNQTQEQER